MTGSGPPATRPTGAVALDAHPAVPGVGGSNAFALGRDGSRDRDRLDGRAHHMFVSSLDLFSVGIGPSSSHTVGPMRAAGTFARALISSTLADQVDALRVDLLGSLAATGRGHETDRAVVLGLCGEHPESTDRSTGDRILDGVRSTGRIRIAGSGRPMPFDPAGDIHFDSGARLDGHPNGLVLTASRSGRVLLRREYLSIGGGFVIEPGAPVIPAPPVPHPFASGAELLAMCAESDLDIAGIMRENELALRSANDLDAGLARVWSAMQACVAAGCASTEDVLPGRLRVPRRAPGLARALGADRRGHVEAMEWTGLWALAVNEENAGGGRVVTAPTNGAAGVIPAVLHFAHRFEQPLDDEAVRTFLLTAAAIGVIIKGNASISGAEVGCQGEIGSACAMAAAGLAAVLGGSPRQVENAAEIGLEHNLGLTCDPIAGLVQVPCIERNAMAAGKAVHAAILALRGTGEHHVSLDAAVSTLREVGRDMHGKYKETSTGGLAVNVPEC